MADRIGVDVTDLIPPGRHEPMVYFIQNGNRVKIGYTTHLAARVAALALSPRFVVLTLEGGRDLESALHRRFATERQQGTEWFVYSQRLKAYIGDHVAQPEPALVTEEDFVQEAARQVVAMQLASASMLQRRMRIGFTRAQGLMVELERRGVVGPLDGPGSSRPVLVRRPLVVSASRGGHYPTPPRPVPGTPKR